MIVSKLSYIFTNKKTFYSNQMKPIQYLLFYNNFVIENTEINKIRKNYFIDTNWIIFLYYTTVINV